MTDTDTRTDRLALLIAESPDGTAMNDLLSSLERSVEIAERLGFNDMSMLVKAARSHAIAEIVDRLY